MILITGASSGIGKACAIQFAKKNQNLILLARRKKRLLELATELKNQFSVEVHVHALDLQNQSEVESFFKKQSTLLSEVTVLINNAGMAKGMGPIQNGKIEHWEQMINTNLKGLLYITHGMLPIFLIKKSGHIINIGSVAGFYSYPNGNVYCSTKAAVRSLTETLRLDLLGTGIRVTEVSPGMVETEFSKVRLENDEAQAKKVYEGMTPLTAQDIAETVVWCEERPKHVNIQEVILYPTDQASPNHVFRK